ncbi:MAG TPA: hypothetical protein VFW80_11025 [Gaiellaceae bacterium]|nr:hypothetical protein [Gaiellaceae bacterium]
MRRTVLFALTAALLTAVWAATAAGKSYSDWTAAQKIDDVGGNNANLNTPFLDGCPIQSPDGLSLYMATNRPRFVGDTRTDLDIWVARRASVGAPWGAPVNLGAPVNSTADDFCPTPIRGRGLFFVSRKVTGVSCGLGDIYFTRFNPERGWREPSHLACAPAGPNSALDEQGPSYFETAAGAFLYFSSSSAVVPGDVYASPRRTGMRFGPAEPVAELSSSGNDIQPNVRKDGLEVVFSSNRTGTLGGQDIWSATRSSADATWSAPVNLGAAVNTAAAETRPALSWDARSLLFGRAPGPEGMSDIYVSSRT